MEKPAIMVRIDDALNELARRDLRKARLIEMRFFGGLTAEESAAALELPVHVVRTETCALPRLAAARIEPSLERNRKG